jgi:hypothetical protein
MRTLSIRQPWAWLIVQRHKTIENRDWFTAYRGPFQIHAGAGIVQRDYRELAARLDAELGIMVPPFTDLDRGPRGGIVGVATLTGIVTESDDPFFVGPAGWLLADAQPLPFVACKGQLSWFDAPRHPALDPLPCPA